MNNEKIKLIISYHKTSRILQSDIMLPVQVGASLSYDDLHIQRDDENDNISSDNKRLCELTAQYWAWKNIDADYYGFMHYRRHFIFSDIPDEADFGGLVHFEQIDDDYIEKIGLDDEHIQKEVLGYDIILPPRLDMWDFSCLSNEVQFSSLTNLHGRDFSTVCDVIKELYPEYTDAIERFRNGHYVYWYNMFIMKKRIFFEYCEWLFSILFEAEKRIDFSGYDSQEQRTLAFMAERLLSIFVFKYLTDNQNCKLKQLKMSFVRDTDVNSVHYNSDVIIRENYELLLRDRYEKGALVSIVIPLYNADAYIANCLFSFVNQTYKNIEIICVDDGSEDDSSEIIKATQRIDSRIKLIQQKNQFAGIARNNGFKMVNGKYVIFFDADDYAEPEFVEKMVAAIENSQSDIAICNAKGFNDITKREHYLGNSVLNKNALPYGKLVFSPSVVKNSVFQITAGWTWDKIFRVDLIRNNNILFQDLRSSNDALFVNIACALADRLVIVPEVLVVHRSHVVSSLEYTKSSHWECAVEMLRSLKKELIKRDLFKTYELSYINFCVGTIVAYLTSTYNLKTLSEMYLFVKNKLIEELGLFGYDKECFLDEKIFESFAYIEYHSLDEFICFHQNVFADALQNIDELLHDRDNIISIMDSTIVILNSKIATMTNDKHWYFPEENYPAATRFALYGFGKVGKDFARQLANSKHSELVAVIDKNHDAIDEPYLKDIKGGDMSILRNLEYDYVIISPRKTDVAKQIRSDLLDAGVEKNKIICPILEESNE